MPQERVHANKVGTKDEATHTTQDDAIDEAVVQAKERGEKVTTDDADDWLDDIDEALAENGSTSELAAAFVAAYLQKGGQ